MPRPETMVTRTEITGEEGAVRIVTKTAEVTTAVVAVVAVVVTEEAVAVVAGVAVEGAGAEAVAEEMEATEVGEGLPRAIGVRAETVMAVVTRAIGGDCNRRFRMCLD
mmetsp:Transcript_30461/g.63731  ORF Transcript_30461/g.63731 Transcript_30461/m.63731 type:complete len:108 (+) Transcript_30461:2953-3276(+)